MPFLFSCIPPILIIPPSSFCLQSKIACVSRQMDSEAGRWRWWELLISFTFPSLCSLRQLEYWQKQQHLLSAQSNPHHAAPPPPTTALSPPPSPVCTHSALRWGLMSNKRWVTIVLESSQLSQMPNWSLEVLHNAKQHSLKLRGKNKER